MQSLHSSSNPPLKQVTQYGSIYGKFVAISAGLLFLTLTSCGSSDPDCGSSATQDLIVQIAKEHPDNTLINYAIGNSQYVKSLLKNTPTSKMNEANQLRIDELLEEAMIIARRRCTICKGADYWGDEDESRRRDLDKVVEKICAIPGDLMARYSIIGECKPFIFPRDMYLTNLPWYRTPEKGLPRSGVLSRSWLEMRVA